MNEIDLLRVKSRLLTEAIQNCLKTVNSRDSEWGSRAIDAIAFLHEAEEEVAKLEQEQES